METCTRGVGPDGPKSAVPGLEHRLPAPPSVPVKLSVWFLVSTTNSRAWLDPDRETVHCLNGSLPSSEGCFFHANSSLHTPANAPVARQFPCRYVSGEPGGYASNPARSNSAAYSTPSGVSSCLK